MTSLTRAVLFLAGAAILGLLSSPHSAIARKAKKDGQTADIPHCAKSLGTVAIDQPQNQWWRFYNLGNPEALIKLLITRSGCFGVVDRGRGLQMRAAERSLAGSGELQRRSNVGKGQIKSADYFIIPDIVGADQNAGGGGVGGALGGLLGRKAAGILGGIKSKKLTAHTLLSVVNARTSEQMFTSEGKVKKKDVRFGVGGFLGFAGALGGGYDDTEIGQVITAAYIVAYRDLVARISALPPPSREEPQKAYTIIQQTYMYKGPSRKDQLRKLRANTVVYPTGKKDGIFLEVEDDFGITGWVSVEDLSAS